jgi:hypothetical protein
MLYVEMFLKLLILKKIVHGRKCIIFKPTLICNSINHVVLVSSLSNVNLEHFNTMIPWSVVAYWTHVQVVFGFNPA